MGCALLDWMRRDSANSNSLDEEQCNDGGWSCRPSEQRSNRDDRPEVGIVEYRVKVDAVHAGFQRTSSCVLSVSYQSELFSRSIFPYFESSVPYSAFPLSPELKLKLFAMRRKHSRRLQEATCNLMAVGCGPAAMERRWATLPLPATVCFRTIVSQSDAFSRVERRFMDSPTSRPGNPQKSCASGPANAEKCNFQRFEPLGKVDYRASRT